MNLLLILILISLSLGQIDRFEIIPSLTVNLADLTSGAIFFLLLFKILTKSFRKKGKLLKPIFIFSSMLFLSNLFSISNYQAKEALVGSLYLVRWLLYASLYFFILNLRKSKKLNLISTKFSLKEGLLIAGFSQTVFGLTQYFFIPDTRGLKWLGWDDHYYRLIGTLLDPGFTGLILTLTMMLALSMKLKTKLKIFMVVTTFLALLLTYSRASYLALMSAILVYLKLKKRLKYATFIIIIFFSLLLVLPKASSEGTNLTRMYSVFQRLNTWERAAQITKENPIFGIGFNFLRYEQRERGFLGADWETSHSASGIQNSYAFILATSGVVGFLAFLGLLTSMTKISIDQLNKSRQSGTLLITSLTAVSVHAIFTNSWFYPFVMLWIWYLFAVEEKSYSS